MRRRNFWYYLTPPIAIGAAGMFVTVPIVTRYLGPEDYGLFALLSAFVAPVAITSAGVPALLGGNFFRVTPAERVSLFSTAIAVEVGLKIAVALSLMLLAPFILPLLVDTYEPVHRRYYLLLLTGTTLNVFGAAISPLLVYLERARTHAVLEVSGWVVGATTSVVSVAAFDVGVESLFLGFAAAGAWWFLVGLWAVRDHLTIALHRRWVRDIIRVGLPTTPANIIVTITESFVRVLVQRRVSLAALGLYAHSMNYRTVFAMGFKAFNRVFVPPLVRAFSNGTLPSTAREAVRQWYVVIFLVGFVTIAFAPDAIALLTHGKFTDSAPLVVFWSFLLPVFTLGTAYTQYLFAMKRNVYVASATSVSAVLTVALAVLGIQFWGTLGVVAAAVIGNFALQSVLRYRARKLGCPRFGDRVFLSVVGALAALAFLHTNIHLPLWFRTIEVAVIAVILIVAFGGPRRFVPRIPHVMRSYEEGSPSPVESSVWPPIPR